MAALDIYAILISLAGFRLIHWLWMGRPPMPELAYRSRCLAWQALRRPEYSVAVAALTGLPLLFPQRATWASFAPVEEVRWAVAAIAAALAWSFSTYSRNHFLGRDHLADRLLLVALSAGLAWHPAFAASFVAMTVVMMRQFEHPRCMDYSHTPVRLPLDVLILLGAFLPARAALGADPACIVVLALAGAGAAYVYAGWAKVLTGPYRGSWLVKNRLDWLIVSSHVNGWLGRVPDKRIVRLARAAAPLGIVLASFTMVSELGAAGVVFDRRAAAIVLGACFVLHAGITAASGVNFWKFMVADAALAWLALGMDDAGAAAVFRPEYAAAGVAVIITAWMHLRPCRLGWFDTRLNNCFRMEAVGASGAVYNLGRTFLAPFDMVFGQGRHFFLYDGRVLVLSYGATVGLGRRGTELIEQLDRTGGDPERLHELKARFGRSCRDEAVSKEFDRFFREFFRRVNAGVGRGPWSLLAAPMHLLSSAAEPAYRGQEPVAAVRVRYIETWYDGAQIRTIHDEIVRDIEIMPEAPKPVLPQVQIAPHLESRYAVAGT